MLVGSGKAEYESARATGNDDFLTYGRRDPLRNGHAASNPLSSRIAEIPALPNAFGFVPTGDPAVDEFHLQEVMRNRGSEPERKLVQDVIDQRRQALQSRKKEMEKYKGLIGTQSK